MTATDELRQQLAEGRERLLRAIAGVSEEQFKRRPPKDGDEQPWSIAEVLAHLLQQEKLRTERIAIALRDDGATITPSPPELHVDAARAGRTAPVPQLIHGLLAARRELDRAIESLDDDGLQHSVVHPQLGKQTVEFMLREKLIDHEAEHTAQIEALRELVGAPPTANHP